MTLISAGPSRWLTAARAASSRTRACSLEGTATSSIWVVPSSSAKRDEQYARQLAQLELECFVHL